MNHLSGVECLANWFSVMRHAQSKANAAGIIVSRVESDRQGDYGLTEHYAAWPPVAVTPGDAAGRYPPAGRVPWL
jgi:hypothetical protein